MLRTAYVNCWSAQTFYAVLETVFQELRALVAEMRDISFKFDRLARIAREKPVIVVLDEVDQMFLKERNATLYNLARLSQVGIVCLSQTRQAYLGLDERVQSRLVPSFIEFPAYTQAEIVAILEARAEKGLEPGTWCRKDLETIAQACGGDARMAVQALRAAAYLAERSRAFQIRPGDISLGLRTGSQLKRRYLLKTLSEHHRLIHALVKEAGLLSTGELWKRYGKAAVKQGLEPMARRTFTHYKQQLVAARLLSEQPGRGRRNTRLLRVIE
jgi:Cdc6-like AAA superfamily ATPase